MGDLLAYKVGIILFFEITAWISTSLLLIAHYKWKSRFGFYVFGIYALIAGWVPHLTIIFYDFWHYPPSLFSMQL
jgi:hypothetical protein